jgi:glycogen debranching enzyme
MSELVNLTQTTVIKAGNAFCVALQDGRLPLDEDHPLGVYVNDCRHLRGSELRINGSEPRLLIASDAAGTAAIYELTNRELLLGDDHVLAAESLRVRVERRIEPHALTDRITLRSYAHDPVELLLELIFDADFRPMLEIRGAVCRSSRDVQHRPTADGLTLSAVGLDARERSTVITCPGAVGSEDRLALRLRLQPGEQDTRDVRFAFLNPDDQIPDEHSPNGFRRRDGSQATPSMTPAGAEAEAWLAGHPRIEVDDQLTDRVLRRCLLDLRLLTSRLDGHRFFAAGVPWYATLFGRDSIITSLEALPFDVPMAEQTLRVLAGRLGTRFDDEHDEEPGKVLHELRTGELAARDLTPLARYYGTVDATPLFLCLLCEHVDWTGSLDLFRELRPRVEAALQWIDQYGDLDGDGLIEYRARSAAGLTNQGWKDSWDGVQDEAGRPLAPPIALVEAQGYVLAAKRRIARLLELEGEGERAEALRADAGRIARDLERFWLPAAGIYSMALDGDKRASPVLASNQGHLLWSLAVPPERAEAIRDALMSDASYSGWGVRTLGADERGYNPVGYHTGTVWPHDNALFALGLRNYGLDEAFLRIFENLLDVASRFSDFRLPELFAGFSRIDYEEPVPYPVACSPQAWAAGSLPAMLIAGLGLVPDALNRVLRIRRPSLPRHLNRLALRGLVVAGASVDLVFERVAQDVDSVALTDVSIDGDIDVVLEIPRDRRPPTAPTVEQVTAATTAAPSS